PRPRPAARACSSAAWAPWPSCPRARASCARRAASTRSRTSRASATEQEQRRRQQGLPVAGDLEYPRERKAQHLELLVGVGLGGAGLELARLEQEDALG